jgi:dTDP-4-dehydrorhamnose 3,5-epimerase-like enzyme
MKKISSHIMNSDDRGYFLQIAQDGWAEVNYVETLANKIRGKHYHKETSELFFIISGEIKVKVENLSSGQSTVFVAKKGDNFIIEPGEFHTFHTITDSQWISLLSQKIDPHNPDFHQVKHLITL